MPADARSILGHLERVSAERTRRGESPELAAKVEAIKRYQQRRFSGTYADLLGSPRYGPVSRFFLDELYGPRDFTQRDAQFARVIPVLVRTFPGEIVAMVNTLVELHALSETLDSSMALNLQGRSVDCRTYLAAWQATADAALREKQVALTLQVGVALDRLTRKPLMRNSLRLMRGPARVAGLGELQRFLEAGFDTFKSMGGAKEFLSLIETRENRLSSALFGAGVADDSVTGVTTTAQAVALLP